jgi:hypothetical protein
MGARRQASLPEVRPRGRPECGSGCGRLGVCDCKAMREERCAVKTRPRVTFAIDRLLGPVRRPNK